MIDRESLTLDVRLDATLPPRPMVDVLLALPRPKVLQRLWAQLGALGALRDRVHRLRLPRADVSCGGVGAEVRDGGRLSGADSRCLGVGVGIVQRTIR